MESTAASATATAVDRIHRSDTALFEHDFLSAHNKFRSLHGVGPLQMNPALCAYAQIWAEFLARNDLLESRPDNVYGENVFMIREKPLSGDEPVKAWYSEIDRYNFSSHKFSPASANFTQLVWKASKELGLGVVKMHKSTFIVANYDPPGNIVGEFKENVLPRMIKPTPEKASMLKQSSMVLGCRPCPEISSSLLSHVHYDAEDEANLRKDILEAHNNYRALHGVLPLRANPDIDNYAKEWAKHLSNRESVEFLLTTRSSTLEPRPHNYYGENLYKAVHKRITGAQVVRKWYEQICAYDFSNPGYTPETGGFTQLIWKSSQYLGIGIAKNGPTTFVVANYYPQGNFPNQFEENVRPVLKKTNLGCRNSLGNITVEEYRQFQLTCLSAHNEYRKKHGVPILRLSEELSTTSRQWACHLAEHNILAHDPDNVYGENVYRAGGKVMNGKDPVKFWYSEIEHYDFNHPGYKPNTGHFTQLVWKNTEELGVGFAKTEEDIIYVVASYNPAGNYCGYFHLNVMAPISDTPQSPVCSKVSINDSYTNAAYSPSSEHFESSSEESKNLEQKNMHLLAKSELILGDLGVRSVAGNCCGTFSNNEGFLIVPVRQQTLLTERLLQQNFNGNHSLQACAVHTMVVPPQASENQELCTIEGNTRNNNLSETYNEELAYRRAIYTKMEKLMHWLEKWSQANEWVENEEAQ